MKKNFLYILLLAFFIGGVGFIIVRSKSKENADKKLLYPFLNRNQNNNIAEWEFAKKNADALIAKLKEKPDDIKASIALANAYIAESRISGNFAYYDRAALKTVEKILEKNPEHYEALSLKSLLQLSQHHFVEGLVTAQQAATINPNNAFVYGLLVDGNIEMGNYKAALDAADKMVSIRPDIRMRLAVSAGVTGEESTEWCRVQLGRLYENMGKISQADYQYKLSLAARPEYAEALQGMSRIASFNNKQDSAIYYLEHASGLVNNLDIKQQLAMAYMNTQQTKKAENIYNEIEREIEVNQKMMAEDPDAGHYSDKELAYLFIQQKNFDRALTHALAEYNRRPLNNDVNEMMAWVYYNRNEISKALPHIDIAMQTGSKNPVLLATAGLIQSANGNKEKGKDFLQEALMNKQVLSADIVQKSRFALEIK